jgi:hypothetical protein
MTMMLKMDVVDVDVAVAGVPVGSVLAVLVLVKATTLLLVDESGIASVANVAYVEGVAAAVKEEVLRVREAKGCTGD